MPPADPASSSTAHLPPADQFTCGIAVYTLDPGTGALDGRFALAVYGSRVSAEPCVKLEGDPGVLPGTYSCRTMTPEGSCFAEGTLTLSPVGDEGVYAVEWVLHLTDESARRYPDWPKTMIYDAIGLSSGDTMISVAWDNAKYRTPD